jgi:hypothetical protein
MLSKERNYLPGTSTDESGRYSTTRNPFERDVTGFSFDREELLATPEAQEAYRIALDAFGLVEEPNIVDTSIFTRRSAIREIA